MSSLRFFVLHCRVGAAGERRPQLSMRNGENANREVDLFRSGAFCTRSGVRPNLRTVAESEQQERRREFQVASEILPAVSRSMCHRQDGYRGPQGGVDSVRVELVL